MRYMIYTLLLILLTAIPAFAGHEHQDMQGDMQIEMHGDMQCDKPDGTEPGGCPEGDEGECREFDPELWFQFMMDHGVFSQMDVAAIDFMADAGTIAILPISDVGEIDFVAETADARNLRFANELAQEFIMHDFYVTPVADAAIVFQSYGLTHLISVSAQNNLYHLESTPQRALDYYVEMVPELGDHLAFRENRGFYIATDDVKKIAEELGADVIIRGFISARSQEIQRSSLDNWFADLLNQKDNITVLQATFYMYNGETGELLWNGVTDVWDHAGWPLFWNPYWHYKQKQIGGMGENMADFHFMWNDIVTAHPWWVYPEGMCREMDREVMCIEDIHVERPPWLNPYRDGWHDEYHRAGIRFEQDPYEGDFYRYRGVVRHYQYLRSGPSDYAGY